MPYSLTNLVILVENKSSSDSKKQVQPAQDVKMTIAKVDMPNEPKMGSWSNSQPQNPHACT